MHLVNMGFVRSGPGAKGKPSPANWGERLTGSGFVSQWGFSYLAALAKPPNPRGHSIAGYLEVIGPLFKLITTALTTP
jgi:hypothetical protein